MEGGSDPYEKQLLDVFESCDFEGSGRLDSVGLTQLCDKLQLEEQGVKLIDCLLSKNAQRRVTFTEFREALLSLLGEGQKKKQKKFERSPEREVSPKYVFGKKKYGRRSRPESIDQDSDEACNTEESDSEVFLQNPAPKNDNLLWPVADVSEPSKTKVYKKRRKSVDRRLAFDKEISNRSPEENFSKARISKLSSDEEGPEKDDLEELKCFSTPDKAVKVSSTSDLLLNSDAVVSQETFINMTLEAREEADNLRSVCKQLGIGEDGSLSKTELARLCKCIGMETKAEYIVQELFEKLDVDLDNRISFEEFLSLFLSGDVGTEEDSKDDSLEELPSKRDDQTVTSGYSTILDDPLDRNTLVIGNEKDSLPCILDVNNSGCMSLESVVSLWGSWGVSDPEKLVEDLGFGNEEHVPFPLLYSTMEGELRSMLAEESEEERGTRGDPKMDVHHPAPSSDSQLLRAAIGLYLTETKLLKISMDHMKHERDKLQMDLAEANHRASLLAQEVDDHHARLEKSSQLQVKLLEQRHAEMIRELQEQSSLERESLASQNADLEKKLLELQLEECHLREECLSLKKENEMLEKENQSLLEQVAKCEEDKLKLSEQIEMLSFADQELGGEMGSKKWLLGKEEKGMAPMIEKLEALQEENRSLRDRNDELTMELEEAMSKLSSSSFCKNEGSKFAWLESELADDGEVRFTGDAVKGGELLTKSERLLVGMKMEDETARTPLFEEMGGELDGEQLSSNYSMSLPGESIEASLKVEGDDLWSVSKENVQKHEEARVPELEHTLQLDSKQLQADLVNRGESVIDKGNREDASNVALQSKQLTKALEEFQKEAVNYLTRIEDSENKEKEESGSVVDALDSAAAVFSFDPSNEDDRMLAKDNPLLTEEQSSEHSCKDLKSKLEFMKLEIVKILSEKEACSAENSALRSQIFHQGSDVVNSISKDNAQITLGPEEKPSEKNDSHSVESLEKSKALEKELEELKVNLKEMKEQHEKEKQILLEHCKELEKSLELLNIEYEKCEDYWQQKLEDERSFYEETQRLTDERQNNLEQKIAEYDQMFCQKVKAESRLPMIEERVSLERQVTDLEEECEELRIKVKESEALHLKEKERLSFSLQEMEQQMLKEQQSHKKSIVDACVQADFLEHKQQNTAFTKADAANKHSSKSNRTKVVPNGGSTSCLNLSNHFSCQQCRGKNAVDNLYYEREVDESGRSRICMPNSNSRKNMVNDVGSEEHDDWQSSDVETLEAILSSTKERLHKQTLICQNQAERLMQADILVQKLYLENAFLRNYLQQCQEY